MNHHKLIPEFLRSGIDLTYSDQLEDLNPETLAQYEAVLMYRGGAIGKPERIDHIINYVENGGGLVAIHHTCGAFDGDTDFISLIGGEFARHGSGIFTATHVPGQEDHPALGGIEPFSTWDETYVHKNLNDDRTDLQVRDEKDALNHGPGCVTREQAVFSTPPTDTTGAHGKSLTFKK